MRLARHLSVPLLATEITPGGLEALPPWITSGATDFLRGDVVIKGGITGLVKIAHLAEAFGMNCEIHDSYNALNNVAALHVAMAVHNCDWLEILAFNSAGAPGLEHWNYGLATPVAVDGSGYVHAPARPGPGRACRLGPDQLLRGGRHQLTPGNPRWVCKRSELPGSGGRPPGQHLRGSRSCSRTSSAASQELR